MGSLGRLLLRFILIPLGYLVAVLAGSLVILFGSWKLGQPAPTPEGEAYMLFGWMFAAPVLVAVLPLMLMGLSFGLLSVALRVIPMAVAYAVWEGLGIVGIALIGHAFFAEHLTVSRILALTLIIGGIVLLERGVGHDATEEDERRLV